MTRLPVVFIAWLGTACATLPTPSGPPPDASLLYERSDGDFSFPRLSPSGRYLAYAEAVPQAGYTNTRVLVVDLSHGATDTVVTAAAARALGVYASTVSAIRWRGDDLLDVVIHDGDVGTVNLSIERRSGLATTSRPAGGAGVSERNERLADRLSARYPAIRADVTWPANAVFLAALDESIAMGDTGVIVQHTFSGFDGDIWFYGVSDSVAVRLVDLPEDGAAYFGGGGTFGGSAVFAVTRLGRVVLYTFTAGGVRRAGRTRTRGTVARLAPRGGGRSGIWLRLDLAVGERAVPNRALVFDGARLRDVLRDVRLDDVHVNATETRIAVTRWVGLDRAISVRRLP